MKTGRIRPDSAYGWIGAVFVLAVFLLVFLAPPARAAKGVRYDPRGDAIAGFDILRVVAFNGKRKLRLKTVYRGRLRPHYSPGVGVSASIDLDFGAPADSVYDPDATVGVSFGVPGEANHFYLYRNRKKVRCRGFRGHVGVKRGVIRLVVPQRCFKRKAGRVRIAGETYAIKGGSLAADYMDSWGRWIARG